MNGAEAELAKTKALLTPVERGEEKEQQEHPFQAEIASASLEEMKLAFQAGPSAKPKTFEGMPLDKFTAPAAKPGEVQKFNPAKPPGLTKVPERDQINLLNLNPADPTHVDGYYASSQEKTTTPGVTANITWYWSPSGKLDSVRVLYNTDAGDDSSHGIDTPWMGDAHASIGKDTREVLIKPVRENGGRFASAPADMLAKSTKEIVDLDKSHSQDIYDAFASYFGDKEKWTDFTASEKANLVDKLHRAMPSEVQELFNRYREAYKEDSVAYAVTMSTYPQATGAANPYSAKDSWSIVSAEDGSIIPSKASIDGDQFNYSASYHTRIYQYAGVQKNPQTLQVVGDKPQEYFQYDGQYVGNKNYLLLHGLTNENGKPYSLEIFDRTRSIRSEIDLDKDQPIRRLEFPLLAPPTAAGKKPSPLRTITFKPYQGQSVRDTETEHNWQNNGSELVSRYDPSGRDILVREVQVLHGGIYKPQLVQKWEDADTRTVTALDLQTGEPLVKSFESKKNATGQYLSEYIEVTDPRNGTIVRINTPDGEIPWVTNEKGEIVNIEMELKDADGNLLSPEKKLEVYQKMVKNPKIMEALAKFRAKAGK